MVNWLSIWNLLFTGLKSTILSLHKSEGSSLHFLSASPRAGHFTRLKLGIQDLCRISICYHWPKILKSSEYRSSKAFATPPLFDPRSRSKLATLFSSTRTAYFASDYICNTLLLWSFLFSTAAMSVGLTLSRDCCSINSPSLDSGSTFLYHNI